MARLKRKLTMDKWINYILIVLLIAVPSWFGLKELTVQMGLMTAAIGLGLFFANIDKFQKFKGAGIEAEMRIEKAVEKTYAAIEQLQQLAIGLAAPVIEEMTVSGTFGGYIPLQHKLMRVNHIAEVLKELGASKADIDIACATIYDRVRDEHFRRAVNHLKHANLDKSALFEGIDPWGDDWDPSRWTEGSLNAFVKDHALAGGDEAKEWMADLTYFLEHKKLRREDKWQA